jgi:NADH/NAD ratio-sensing transcriptional regulator Rex
LDDNIVINGDNALVSENIRKDVSIFGVIGSLQEGYDTSDANIT